MVGLLPLSTLIAAGFLPRSFNTVDGRPVTAVGRLTDNQTNLLDQPYFNSSLAPDAEYTRQEGFFPSLLDGTNDTRFVDRWGGRFSTEGDMNSSVLLAILMNDPNMSKIMEDVNIRVQSDMLSQGSLGNLSYNFSIYPGENTTPFWLSPSQRLEGPGTVEHDALVARSSGPLREESGNNLPSFPTQSQRSFTNEEFYTPLNMSGEGGDAPSFHSIDPHPEYMNQTPQTLAVNAQPTSQPTSQPASPPISRPSSPPPYSSEGLTSMAQEQIDQLDSIAEEGRALAENLDNLEALLYELTSLVHSSLNQGDPVPGPINDDTPQSTSPPDSPFEESEVFPSSTESPENFQTDGNLTNSTRPYNSNDSWDDIQYDYTSKDLGLTSVHPDDLIHGGDTKTYGLLSRFRSAFGGNEHRDDSDATGENPRVWKVRQKAPHRLGRWFDNILNGPPPEALSSIDN